MRGLVGGTVAATAHRFTHTLSLSLVLRPGEKRNEVGFKGGAAERRFDPPKRSEDHRMKI
jgi:hypothetical protein